MAVVTTTPSELKRRSCEHSMRSCCSRDELSFVALFPPVGSSFRTRAAPPAEVLALRHHSRFFKRTPRLVCASSVPTGSYGSCGRDGGPGWRRSLHIVRPILVVAWHRRGFAWYWMRKSRSHSRVFRRRATVESERVIQ